MLSAVVTGAPAPTAPGEQEAAFAGVLQALALVWSGCWEEAHRALAATPAPAVDDAGARWLRAAVTLWTAAADPTSGSADALAVLQGPPDGRSGDLLGDLSGDLSGAVPDVGDAVQRTAAYLLVEGALAHARLDLAQALAERCGERLWQAPLLPGAEAFDPVVQLCRARLAAFRGEVDLAERLLAAITPPEHPRVAALVAATRCLVLGNALQPAQVRRLVAKVDALLPDPPQGDLVVAGCQMLVAFGLIALGEVTAAARRVLLAGGDAALSRLDVVDRALGLEMLVALAADAEDLDAAEAWLVQLLPLLASPIADSTVLRAVSRVALLAGRVEEAVVAAEEAVARAQRADRRVEAAEGGIVLGRARLRGGSGVRADAVHALQALVDDAEGTGLRAARRSAARELRPLGRRLAPLAGSGWSSLSPRETEVARLVVAGATNREVAGRLHLSPHTVRAHVSRVLAAFGVATRAELPGRAGDAAPGDTAVVPAGAAGGAVQAAPLGPLTARQAEVAVLVARGLPDEAVAAALGISVRTVRKHLGDVAARWGLHGRTAVAHAVVSGRWRPGAPPTGVSGE
ncbi:helix-turn-helix transcriptional regulator [Nocardioides nanhaiensis]|uniref:HTH luxR-type domain-containing protein n=1 Tax=Nocardioides nanhaiensis TaxID=1476871 RepID=A0ABP8WG50_9ACTN